MPVRTLLARCTLGLVLVLLSPLAAALGPATYTGTAPVNSQSDADRTGALQTALANVVIAQTGDSSVIARPDVAKAVAEAERYVLQYQYKSNAGADDVAKMTLIAQFDSVAVDKMLSRLGLGGTSGSEDIAAQSETPSEATVWIGGIHSANDYVRVLGYLTKNNFVRAAQPLQAHADGILVKLSLATDLGHFLDAVGMEHILSLDATAAHVDGVEATLALAR